MTNEQKCIPVGCVLAERWPYSGVWSWVGCIPKESRNQKKIPPNPSQKKLETPEKLEAPPEKLETPKKLETPQKIGAPLGLTFKACWDTHPPGTDLQGMLGYPHPPPPPTAFMRVRHAHSARGPHDHGVMWYDNTDENMYSNYYQFLGVILRGSL